ncbi:MAG: isopentenyl-diphosphate Delta-isomerase [Bacteroidota bacterium]
MNKIVLVNERDENIGECEKLEAHQKGLLHRAFSIFICNTQGEFLLQKRATHKYHSPRLWSNTCCSHDVVGIDFQQYIPNRLFHEMGLKTPVERIFTKIYNLDCGNGLIENELNYVFYGVSDEKPSPNPDEVSEYRYIDRHTLNQELQNHPDQFTEWFKVLYPLVLENIQ